MEDMALEPFGGRLDASGVLTASAHFRFNVVEGLGGKFLSCTAAFGGFLLMDEDVRSEEVGSLIRNTENEGVDRGDLVV
jgi:hypothetical protein